MSGEMLPKRLLSTTSRSVGIRLFNSREPKVTVPRGRGVLPGRILLDSIQVGLFEH